MAYPVADSYKAPSGGALYGGRFSLPAWRRNLALNTWTEIPNTSGAGGSAVDAWGAFAIKPSNSELIIAAAGGHGDSSDNGVYSIRLSDDAPTWQTRKTSSAPTADVLYYADGTPTSRHLYAHLHYLESLDAVLLAGCRYGYGGGTPTGPGMDLFSLVTNTYLSRYTFADIPDASYGVVKDGAGRIWTTTGRRFDPLTNTWSETGGSLPRFPAAYDSMRDRLFGMCFGDGQGNGSGLTASRVNPSTGATESITFNASAAYSAWIAAAPAYAALDYDPNNDRFLFYHGGETWKVYVITPNSGTTWDMAVLNTSGTPTAAVSAGINKRFTYVPKLGGFVLLLRASSNLYFLRTA